MNYILVVHETPEAFAERDKGEASAYFSAWRVYYRSLVAAGVYVGGAPLKEVATATTVRVQGGKTRVQDGPFAETKEQLAGFMILDLPSLDDALAWAARCPAAGWGAIEVRPMAVDVHERIVRE